MRSLLDVKRLLQRLQWQSYASFCGNLMLPVTTMSKVPECDSCQFYPQNPRIICAIHPFGIDEDNCLDFRPDPNIQPEDEELWSPEGYCFYNGELIKNPVQTLTPEQQLEIIDTHPLFTGCCPECGYKFPKDNPPAVHWDCPACGWIDDAIH